MIPRQKTAVPPDRSARRRSRARTSLAGGDGSFRAGGSPDRRREVAGAHGRALHGQRRQHHAVDAARDRAATFKLSPTLQPLEDLKDQLLVVSNLWNAAANTGDGHYAKESSLLTCTTITKTLGVDINIHGPSMDQVAAQRAGDQTPLPSLELGIEPESTGVDANVGYTRVYGCHIAWSGPTTPLARETNPRSVYERAVPGRGSRRRFGQAGHAAARPRARAIARRCASSSAPPIRRASTSISHRAVAGDPHGARQRPEAHLEAAWCRSIPRPTPRSDPATHAEHVRLMLDMIALAFQSDTTRISTFMFGNAVSGVNFRFLEGVTRLASRDLAPLEGSRESCASMQSSTAGTSSSTDICCASCAT